MHTPKLGLSLFLLLTLITLSMPWAAQGNGNVFGEYIGGEGKNVKFTDVPINPKVDFHFLLSFAIDYTDSVKPQPANGDFKAFWDFEKLSPSAVVSIKERHPNVKVAMVLGGDTVQGTFVQFLPTTVSSWVSNAIKSITQLVQEYNLDGLDIDYEHFDHTDPDTFAECIGKLFFHLKQHNIVKFTSIAPFDSQNVQPFYLALWRKYGHLIDFVNFQFYAYDPRTTIPQFLQLFENQRSNYEGSNLLVSFGTDGSGGLKPANGFFEACNRLKKQDKLHGIFVWSADSSNEAGNFSNEIQAQKILAA